MSLLLAPLLAIHLSGPRLLAVDNFILGEYRNGVWAELSYNSPRAKTFSPMTWYPVGLTTPEGSVMKTGVKIEVDGYAGVYLANSDGQRRGVYLSGAKPGRPRPIETLPTTNATYRTVLRRWLDAKGMHKSPLRITRLLRADLDGDGTKEVLLEARSADDLPSVGFERKENTVDYSLVLLRTVRAGKVLELPLEFARADGPQGSAGESRLRAVADLDGDGRMEIVLGWSAWEVHAAEFHSYRAGKTKRLLQNGSAL